MFRFTEQFVALDYEGLTYNPCDDVIFPSVIRVDDKLKDPKAKYYMYFAPHNAPGGICLVCSDDLTGPWTEIDGNPLIEKDWLPHYEVSHISSPHAIWRPDLEELWLYYHGENTTTRWARSKDGVSFTYGGEAVQTPEMAEMSGASYARVFDSPFEGTPRFLMVILLFKYAEGTWERFEKFGLYGAWSDDGEVWDLCNKPIASLDDFGPSSFVCSPFVWSRKGRTFLIFHLDEVTDAAVGRNLTSVCGLEINANLGAVSESFTVCDRAFFGEGNQRFADPCLVEEDGAVFLFGAIGPRLNQRIGCAVGTWYGDGRIEPKGG
ncbi:hypothetical protein MK139_06375 [bacterium]|nr:hypothetical protein [bacterium]HCK08275.1 hypothetical protein [Candidatus Latescibacterota bacterium]